MSAEAFVDMVAGGEKGTVALPPTWSLGDMEEATRRLARLSGNSQATPYVGDKVAMMLFSCWRDNWGTWIIDDETGPRPDPGTDRRSLTAAA